MNQNTLLNKKMVYQEYIRREEAHHHEAFESENMFYAATKNGDIALLERLLKGHNISEKKDLGKLSDSHLQNLKYHFAISTAMVARHCIEGGMEREIAFNLSDQFINLADSKKEPAEIDILLKDMLFTYAKRMQKNSRLSVSKEISQSISFIYENLHCSITTTDIANAVGLDRSYLSKLFKAQMGIGLKEYVMNRKLETAKNMLLYSDYEISYISEVLAFSSQSHFTNLFKKKYETTPKNYRSINYVTMVEK